MGIVKRGAYLLSETVIDPLCRLTFGHLAQCDGQPAILRLLPRLATLRNEHYTAYTARNESVVFPRTGVYVTIETAGRRRSVVFLVVHTKETVLLLYVP